MTALEGFAKSSSIAVVCIGPCDTHRIYKGISGQIAGNVWHIKNQYYEALIRLHECKDMKDAIGCPVLAVIAEDFQKLQSAVQDSPTDWPELDCKLLIHASEIGRALDENGTEAQTWLAFASDNQFELIDAEATDQNQQDSDIGDLQRAGEAIQAHLWPSLTTLRKDDKLDCKLQLVQQKSSPSEFEDDFAPFESADSANTPLETMSAQDHSETSTRKDQGSDLLDLENMIGQIKAIRAQMSLIEDYDARKVQAEALADHFASLWTGNREEEWCGGISRPT